MSHEPRELSPAEIEQDDIQNEWSDAIYDGEEIAIAALITFLDLSKEQAADLREYVFPADGLPDLVYELQNEPLNSSTFEEIRDYFAGTSIDLFDMQLDELPTPIQLDAEQKKIAVELVRAIVSAHIDTLKHDLRLPLKPIPEPEYDPQAKVERQELSDEAIEQIQSAHISYNEL